MKKKIILNIVHFLLVIILIVFCTCNENSTKPPPEPEITLSLSEEPRLTEIRLKIELKNITLPAQIELTRNSDSIITIQMIEEDSIIQDKGLRPETNYNYRSYLLSNGMRTDSSNLFETSTMDTTTHNYTWTTYNIGYISSVLWDVFALSNDDVWAVGEIYSDSGEYNAVHWDGNEWQLINIEVEYLGHLVSPPMNGIYGFSNNDVWTATGSPWHWDGYSWIFYHLWDMGILAQEDGGVPHMWGTSSSNMYFAGEKGSLVHYDGSNWIKLESGTDLNLTDIIGFNNDHYCVIASSLNQQKYELLIYQDRQLIRKIQDSQYIKGSLWGSNPDDLYVVGEGLFHFDGDSLKLMEWPTSVPSYFMSAIRGKASNNVFAVGNFCTVLHFNGNTWHYYPQLALNEHCFGVSVTENEVFIVGTRGMIYHGK